MGRADRFAAEGRRPGRARLSQGVVLSLISPLALSVLNKSASALPSDRHSLIVIFACCLSLLGRRWPVLAARDVHLLLCVWVRHVGPQLYLAAVAPKAELVAAGAVVEPVTTAVGRAQPHAPPGQAGCLPIE